MPTAKTLTQLEGAPTWSSRHRGIGHYGGALDKESCGTESLPYAWGWYRELQAMRGSAYSYETSGLVHVENLAIARSEAARTRAAEKVACNAQPLTADEKLEEWATILGVAHYVDDTRQDLRLRCAAHYKIARSATSAALNGSLGTLLGENFVRYWRVDGDTLSAPPPQTFWPVINPGPTAYSLETPQGDGAASKAFFSERAHITVEVRLLASQTEEQFLTLMNVHLFAQLDRVLGSQVTFNWALGVTDGFVLDYSRLDFNGFGYD